jgi:hypothetical protein
MEITGYDVPFLDIISPEKLCDREFPHGVTDNDITDAVLMMNDDSAHVVSFLTV